jgi:hypothetical protein
MARKPRPHRRLATPSDANGDQYSWNLATAAINGPIAQRRYREHVQQHAASRALMHHIHNETLGMCGRCARGEAFPHEEEVEEE